MEGKQWTNCGKSPKDVRSPLSYIGRRIVPTGDEGEVGVEWDPRGSEGRRGGTTVRKFERVDGPTEDCTPGLYTTRETDSTSKEEE